MASTCVILAAGFEEIEAITVIDVLRRADIQTRMLGLTAMHVTGSHGITVCADALLADQADRVWDAVG